MSLLSKLVADAIRNGESGELGGIGQLRPVVEKEIVHHEVLRIMNDGGFLRGLTFIGGTCLRACYGSNRLSEDLDFAGGTEFHRSSMENIKDRLEDRLHKKYGLPIEVSEPSHYQEGGNVDTWKIRITTSPQRPDLPKQRINLDICALPSYEPQLRTLMNPYGVHLGTENMTIHAESRREIFTDKIVALALRPGRIKNRDLWDIAWLTQQRVKPAFDLLGKKLADREVSAESLLEHLEARVAQVQNDETSRDGFNKEMRRFVPRTIATTSIDMPEFWPYIQTLSRDLLEDTRIALGDTPAPDRGFGM